MGVRRAEFSSILNLDDRRAHDGFDVFKIKRSTPSSTCFDLLLRCSDVNDTSEHFLSGALAAINRGRLQLVCTRVAIYLYASCPMSID